MPSAEFPRTIRRGPLKGQYFETEADYDAARALVPDTPADVPPSTDADAPPAAAPSRRQRSARGKVTQEMVYAIVFPLNLGLYMIPATRADVLSDEETTRLCAAIVKVASVNQYVNRAILASVESSAYVELAVVVGAIAVKRAANHGYLPASVGAGVSSLFLGETTPTPGPVGDGAPGVNGAIDLSGTGVSVA